eukprot:CAMPEP_0202890906 /NCGR_PEP_ID=MMETSP1392-20130828/1158_1 /ASSEMBLY_ACC=CAM_ASM_000868 /TAXON_ID=225041 /ORGANISM="Chlamydomonas chlamydogama, Strain SAG 11-48b" /LENGTH=613 /DNA_ID=CAMNT_0049574557 /DNA_START=90 /DNA_END=1931 /DNA_ORIENTATION=-
MADSRSFWANACLKAIVITLALCLMNQPAASAKVVNIIHMNDVHNRIEPATASFSYCSRATDQQTGTCFGGWSRIASYIRSQRALRPQTLVLDAGDQYMGTVYDAVYKGNTTGPLFNAVGVNATVLGNHEFDFGIDQLVGNLKGMPNVPVLGACNAVVNTSAGSGLDAILKKWTIFRLKGLKIAVIGVTTPELAYTTLQPADRHKVSFLQPVPALRQCVRELRAKVKHISAIIVLSHVGYPLDIEIAQQVAYIDLIIGGHSHSFLYGNSTGAVGPVLLVNSTAQPPDLSVGPYPTFVPSEVSRGKTVAVTTAYFTSRYLGNLEIEFNSAKRVAAIRGMPVLLGGANSSNPVPFDPVVERLITQWSPSVDIYQKTILGSTKVTLDVANVRRAETRAGNVACDAQLWYIKTETAIEQQFGPVNICLLNGGGVRAPVEAGNITAGQVYNMIPFGNVISVLGVTGQYLLDALENGVSRVTSTSGTGRFPVVSGLKFVYNATLPAGSRITKAAIRAANGTEMPIDPCATYNVLTNDYMMGGGDGYVSLAISKKLFPSGATFDSAARAYIGKFSPLDPKLEGRILACTWDSAWGAPVVPPPVDPSCTAPLNFPRRCNRP